MAKRKKGDVKWNDLSILVDPTEQRILNEFTNQGWNKGRALFLGEVPNGSLVDIMRSSHACMEWDAAAMDFNDLSYFLLAPKTDDTKPKMVWIDGCEAWDRSDTEQFAIALAQLFHTVSSDHLFPPVVCRFRFALYPFHWLVRAVAQEKRIVILSVKPLSVWRLEKALNSWLDDRLEANEKRPNVLEWIAETDGRIVDIQERLRFFVSSTTSKSQRLVPANATAIVQKVSLTQQTATKLILKSPFPAEARSLTLTFPSLLNRFHFDSGENKNEFNFMTDKIDLYSTLDVLDSGMFTQFNGGQSQNSQAEEDEVQEAKFISFHSEEARVLNAWGHVQMARSSSVAAGEWKPTVLKHVRLSVPREYKWLRDVWGSNTVGEEKKQILNSLSLLDVCYLSDIGLALFKLHAKTTTKDRFAIRRTFTDLLDVQGGQKDLEHFTHLHLLFETLPTKEEEEKEEEEKTKEEHDKKKKSTWFPTLCLVLQFVFGYAFHRASIPRKE